MKTYKGYMKFPLLGAKTFVHFMNTCEFFGDFYDPVKRQQIFSKPRRFKMQVYLKDKGGYDIIDLTPQRKINKIEIAEILHRFAVENYKGHDLDNSFFKVII